MNLEKCSGKDCKRKVFMKNKLILILLFGQLLSLTGLLAKEWRVLQIRSKIEFEKTLPGGEGEQHPHSIARSLNNPDYIYLSHDVGGCWRSVDAGKVWEKTLDNGLFLCCCQSTQVDPNNPKLVFIIVQSYFFPAGKAHEGLYHSVDGGKNWKFVLATDVNFNRKLHRKNRHNISYDLSTALAGKPAQRWYAAFPRNGSFR
jgi:photosystem II stability/assembly factor-like uncharacterized protein